MVWSEVWQKEAALKQFNSVPAGSYELVVSGEPEEVVMRNCRGEARKYARLLVRVGLEEMEWLVFCAANPSSAFAQLVGIAAANKGMLSGLRLRVIASGAGCARRYNIEAIE